MKGPARVRLSAPYAPAALLAALLFVALTAGAALLVREGRAEHERAFESARRTTSARLERTFRERLASLERLAKRLGAAEAGAAGWREVAEALVASDSMLLAADWRKPPPGSWGAPCARAVALARGGHAVALWAPASAEIGLELALAPESFLTPAEGIDLQLESNGVAVWRSDGAAADAAWSAPLPLSIAGPGWQARFAPRSDGKARAASHLPAALLAGGVLCALLLGYVLRLSQSARAQTRAADELLETAPDAMVIVDFAGCVTNVNQLALDMFGYTREQLLRQPVEILVPERLREAHVADRFRFAQNPERRRMGSGREVLGRRADGSEFPIEISLIPVQLEHGLAVSMAIRDIGPRLAVERHFRDLLEAAPDAMVIADAEGRIELVNAQTEHLFGYTRSELIGEPFETLIPEFLRLRHRGHVLGYLEAPRPVAMSGDRILVARHKNGTEIPVEISLSPIETEKGLLFSAAVRDASVRHEVETSLRLAARTLEQRVEERTGELGDRARELVRINGELEEFVYAVSHDLKSPLRGVSSLAEWLHEDCAERLSDEEKGTLELLRSRVAKMHQVIDGALDFSRTTRVSNAKMLETERVVREARDFVDPAGACDLRIEGELPSIRYDEAQLTRVFQNLIGNALQHAGGAGASVAISCVSVAQGWEFRVRDRGPGVAFAHRERIFRMFQKLSTDPNSTGIGLAIVKKIVESNGGVVGVRDAPVQGAEFFFTVPAA